MKPNDYFNELGIDQNATTGEIRKAYRKLAFKYHPDHNTGEDAKRIFARIVKAYNVLVDPVKRDEYVKGQSTSITDEPLTVLKYYWKLIYQKGSRSM